MNLISENYINDIIIILESNDDFSVINELLEEYHHYEIAKVLVELDDNLIEKLYKSLSVLRLTDIFEELSPKDAFDLFEKMNLTTVISVLEHIETDDLVDIIEHIEDEEKQMTYLALIPNQKRKVIKSYLHFEEDMVGSIMNNNFMKIQEDMTVKQAIKAVVDVAPSVDFIHNIYVVNKHNILVGTLSLKELIHNGNDKSALIKNLMIENMVYLYPITNIEEAIELMKNYDFQLLPVVNSDQKLIGIISFDDTLEALNIEASSDYAGLAGVTNIDIDEHETVFASLKKRLPWLIILLFVNLITSSIITGYEYELQTLTTLAVFMPLILDMAGNSSTQGLGVIIRLFATNQLKKKKNIFKHLLKELITGFINGLVMGLAIFVIVLLFNVIKGVPFSEGVTFALVIALSIHLSLFVATFSGSLIPLLVNALKIDPAAASGPFITTINDIFSLLIYFFLATSLIAGLS